MNIPRLIVATDALARQPIYYDEFGWLRDEVRYYLRSEEPIGGGRFGVVFLGWPCDAQKVPRGDGQNVVIKVPDVSAAFNSDDPRTKEQTRARLEYIRHKSSEELNHIPLRLRLPDPCSHANPVIDLAEVRCEEDPSLHMTVTIQPFLENALSLDAWLKKMGLRDRARINHEENGNDVSGWKGMVSRIEWCQVALRIGHALKELHLRRVTHSDVHPGNIFITLEKVPRAILIDFGEAFVATPAPNYRTRNARKSYQAPELTRFCKTNESLDVYSFGILLLYLACGDELRLDETKDSGELRCIIEEAIFSRNPRILEDEPRIADIIVICTMTDAANRPRMVDICDELAKILETASQGSVFMEWNCCADPSERVAKLSMKEIVRDLTQRISDDNSELHPVLSQMLFKEVRELYWNYSSRRTEMMDLYGTRERTVSHLTALLDSLKPGDSWTSATTLNVWQGNALGLTGRYSSASIRAVLRGASVRRLFIISVEELGLQFVDGLVSKLKMFNDPPLVKLRTSFEKAAGALKTSKPGVTDDDETAGESLRGKMAWHRDRMCRMFKYFDHIIQRWNLLGQLDTQEAFDLRKSEGFRLAILPVADRDEVERLRANNPAALMYLPSLGSTAGEAAARDESRHWMLVTAETRGRGNEDALGQRPHLIGVRVHPSVQGIPTDRQNHLQVLMKRAVNVSACCEQIAEACRNSN